MVLCWWLDDGSWGQQAGVAGILRHAWWRRDALDKSILGLDDVLMISCEKSTSRHQRRLATRYTAARLKCKSSLKASIK